MCCAGRRVSYRPYACHACSGQRGGAHLVCARVVCHVWYGQELCRVLFEALTKFGLSSETELFCGQVDHTPEPELEPEPES